MAIHKRAALDGVINAIATQAPSQIYLCFGERYLCRQAAGHIEQALLDRFGGAVHSIDGATEDGARLLSRLQSFSLLPGKQIYRVSDTRLFLSKNVGADLWEKALKNHQDNNPDAAARHLASLLALASLGTEEPGVFSALSAEQWQSAFGFTRPGDDPSWADRLISERRPPSAAVSDSGEAVIAAIEKGFPAQNILLLLAENVDKRKRLFTCIKKHGEIIDCCVAEGVTRAAQEEQKQVVRELAAVTLQEFDKHIEPKVLEQLFERIGFHPIAVVREVEKLALYADDRQQITAADLDLLVGRTREDAVFELTEALGLGHGSRCLTVLHRLLRDGIHSLAIIATLRNYLRRLLIFRALQLQPQPAWQQGMSSAEFQNSYLPALKETGAWPDLLKGHPYALYMSFGRAADWSLVNLKRSLSLLLAAEYQLKGSSLPQRLILEELLLSLLTMVRDRTAKDSPY